MGSVVSDGLDHIAVQNEVVSKAVFLGQFHQRTMKFLSYRMIHIPISLGLPCLDILDHLHRFPMAFVSYYRNATFDLTEEFKSILIFLVYESTVGLSSLLIAHGEVALVPVVGLFGQQ